jgi:hypothetical protein
MLNPFLTIVTRHILGRPNMLALNQASVRAQTDLDYEHLIITDHIGRGVEWSHTQFAEYAPQINGDYVFILDDDDWLFCDRAISLLKQAAISRPELIMVRMRHNPVLVLPDDEHWGKPPELGYIGMSAFVVRRDVWSANVAEFRPVYHGDFTFISAVYPKCSNVVWLDRVISATQRGHNHGQPENIHTTSISA